MLGFFVFKTIVCTDMVASNFGCVLAEKRIISHLFQYCPQKVSFEFKKQTTGLSKSVLNSQSPNFVANDIFKNSSNASRLSKTYKISDLKQVKHDNFFLNIFEMSVFSFLFFLNRYFRSSFVVRKDFIAKTSAIQLSGFSIKFSRRSRRNFFYIFSFFEFYTKIHDFILSFAILTTYVGNVFDFEQRCGNLKFKDSFCSKLKSRNMAFVSKHIIYNNNCLNNNLTTISEDIGSGNLVFARSWFVMPALLLYTHHFSYYIHSSFRRPVFFLNLSTLGLFGLHLNLNVKY